MLFNNTPMKINILSNDLSSAESVETVLEENHFIVNTAVDFSEEADIASKNNPDVIILDFWAAEIDGVGLCKDIRTFSIIPILVLSSENKPGMIEQLLNAGADECLIKPASTNILIAHLRTLARRYREEKQAEIVQNNPYYRDVINPVLNG